MKKLALVFLSFLRNIRICISTYYLKMRVSSHGKNVRAAKFPSISTSANVEIGNDVSFNGITITGWGGKNKESLSLWK